MDYRLAPPVTWNLAAPDVACAMAWVASHANEYHVAPDRMLIAGQSAGGGLALQVAYGLGDGTVTSSCGGAVPQPKAVFALYPPDDLAMAWNLDTGLSAVSSRVFNTGYLGGSPEQFPERYRVTSPVFHVRTGLPPTLIAAGAVDHLVPIAGHAEMVVQASHRGGAERVAERAVRRARVRSGVGRPRRPDHAQGRPPISWSNTCLLRADQSFSRYSRGTSSSRTSFVPTAPAGFDLLPVYRVRRIRLHPDRSILRPVFYRSHMERRTAVVLAAALVLVLRPRSSALEPRTPTTPPAARA